MLTLYFLEDYRNPGHSNRETEMATHRPENPKPVKKAGKVKPVKAAAVTNWDELIARNVKLEDRLIKKLRSRHIVRKLKVRFLTK
ncbi:hypothetical protein [Phyllobacterium calauticae]|uniref:hypothetical protein n=1 Tax=Phyllobacterium calauticae TaxID=2817027 RepID=UPI001CBE5F8A|nr:hypothetical protein [Phyllobacterium calauticae]MBZ3695566.1 hypothetical protein [Phyllobacterium calauticae]